jgi:hypothetical protein
MKIKRLFLLGCKKSLVILSTKAFALLVGAPFLVGGCCEVIEPGLSFTLDNSYTILFV